MTVLLKSGLSASRDEAAEEMKECRSTTQPCCLLTVILQDGLSLFHGLFMPRSYHKLLEYPWTTQNLIYVFSKLFLTATFSFIHCSMLGEKKWTHSESSWYPFCFLFGFIYFISIQFMIFYDNYHVWVDPHARSRFSMVLMFFWNIDTLGCLNRFFNMIVLTACFKIN